MTREEFEKKFNEVKKMEFWEDTICNYKKISGSFIQEFVKLSKLSLNIKFNSDDSLYKYSQADIYSIKNLKNSNLFFKFAGKFSDGFDSLFEIDNISKKILNDLFKKKLGIELEKIVQRDCLVTCFTDTNLNDEMWEKYADSHSGFCQEYDLKELQREYIEHNFFKNDNYTENICLVIYGEELFKASKYFPLEYIEDILNIEIFQKIIVPIIFFAALTKLEQFSFENEWRWFKLFTHNLPNKPNFEKVENDLGMLREVIPPKAIYLGKDIEGENKKEIIEICKSKKIKVYQMVEENGILKPIPIEI
ncbi:DUF2971 domain-containing protein [Fusobacterium polymorphum]|uniref:DUF2971 domain-containing protein n=1 Tax=Fusobacterium nucleatum subsp. polymorphum TaxID=76857 RepID=UPI0032564F55